MVYQTDKWIINIKPVFWKELKGLFGNIYPGNMEYKKFRNFYRFYLAVYVLLFAAYSLVGQTQNEEMKKIEVGSKIPEFVLLDQNGKQFDINSVLGKKNLVIYFYPKDDTPGCTKEACTFRDSYEEFKDVDAEVIGISSDGVESHKKFAEKYGLTFTLLSDTDGKLRKRFGVPTNMLGILPGRVTYVVDKTGTVVFIFNSQTNSEQHITEALDALNKIQ
jgi:peroxiredoxin Q/BCP